MHEEPCEEKRNTHWRYHSILSISFNLGLRSGSTVSILSTSCAIADVCADPSRRHGSCARIEPFKYAANSGLAAVGSSQGVSDQVRNGSAVRAWVLLEAQAGRRGWLTAEEESKEDDASTPDVDRLGRIRLRACKLRGG